MSLPSLPSLPSFGPNEACSLAEPANPCAPKYTEGRTTLARFRTTCASSFSNLVTVGICGTPKSLSLLSAKFAADVTKSRPPVGIDSKSSASRLSKSAAVLSIAS